jgi:hypothetical protein
MPQSCPEDRLAVVHLMIDEHNHGLSLRKALAYTDCSRNFYYYKKKRRRITRCQQQDQTILEKTEISQVSYLMSSYHLPNVLSRYSDIAVFCSSHVNTTLQSSISVCLPLLTCNHKRRGGYWPCYHLAHTLERDMLIKNIGKFLIRARHRLTTIYP